MTYGIEGCRKKLRKIQGKHKSDLKHHKFYLRRREKSTTEDKSVDIRILFTLL